MISTLEDVISGLKGRTLLERQKSLERIRKWIGGAEEVDLQNDSLVREQLVSNCLELLSGSCWEGRHGSLLALADLIPCLPVAEGERVRSIVLKGAEDHLMDDDEARVRSALSAVLRKLCQLSDGRTLVYERLKPTWFKLYDEYSQRQDTNLVDDLGAIKDEQALAELDGRSSPSLSSMATPKLPYVEKPSDLRHESEGWQKLESCMHYLYDMVAGCSNSFRECLTSDVLEVLYSTTSHSNRFVRESAYKTCEQLCLLAKGDQLLSVLGVNMSAVLTKGLADNWSQVRFAASCAARAYLLTAQRENLFDTVEIQEVLKSFVSRICLNRYYVAEGVRLYNQETWRVVFKDSGKDMVEKYIAEVVDFYCAQTMASNHAVREAACLCIAELATKISVDVLEPFVQQLLKTLLVCFHDQSWPVRDCACQASGDFVAAYPEAARAAQDDLLQLLEFHVTDNIWSVRENAAVSLGKLAKTWEDVRGKVLEMAKRLLPLALQQPEESKRYGDLQNETIFGVSAKKRRDNDAELHTDQKMYSCGSLAPRMRSGHVQMHLHQQMKEKHLHDAGVDSATADANAAASSCGCMGAGLQRERECWESSDGAVYLLRELAAIVPEEAATLLPDLIAISKVRHFAHCFNMHETIAKQLPAIAKHLGKRLLKPHLTDLIAPLLQMLECGNRLVEHAAADCILALRKFVGPSVFASRLQPDQERVISRHPLLMSTDVKF